MTPNPIGSNSFPLLASEAPAALQYGVYTISAVALLYFFGARFFIEDRERGDTVAALAIVVLTAVLGAVLLTSVSLEAISSYICGLIVGGALVRLVKKYRRIAETG